MNPNLENLRALSATMAPTKTGWTLTLRQPSAETQIKKFFFQCSDVDKLGLDLDKSSQFESQRLERVYKYTSFKVF